MDEHLMLRRASPPDAAAVRDLTRAAYAKWLNVIGREPRPMTADYDVAVREHIVDMLHDKGKLVALIEMRQEVDHLLIVNVAVLPAFQGHGYGRSLLSHAEEYASALQLPELRLYTHSRFTENLLFYERLGYHEYHRELVPDLGTVVHMKKILCAL
jgi:ribosomal protein S18 acetylase RimI-like enzyme